MSDVKQTASAVKEVEYEDLDELLGTKASTVIAPDENSKKSVLASTTVDTSFLDNPNNDLDNDDEPEPVNVPATDDLANILDDDVNVDVDDNPSGDSNASKAGRKPALIEVVNKLTEKGLIDLFEDAPNIEDYTIEDIEELLEQNIIHKVNETAKQAPVEVFKRLDPKLQDVISYALSGGTDITSVLKNVTRAQEITELSLEKEEDQEQIVREWLRETNFGSDDEIDEEITAYLDRNELAKKAKQFKPKLDSKQAEIMQKKLLEQETKRKAAEEAKKNYANKIFQELNKPELNGLKLNNRIQTALYYGITDTNKYQDREGNPTNELGHLLEKYQFGESANPSLILEALWLLKDPDGYRKSLTYIGEKQATANTVRKLKSAEAERQVASSSEGNSRGIPATRPAQKPNQGRRNIFSRD
jgi:hypothetical protein